MVLQVWWRRAEVVHTHVVSGAIGNAKSGEQEGHHLAMLPILT